MSMASDCGMHASDEIVLHTNAISNCIQCLHSQMSAVMNLVSVCLALLHHNELS